MNEQEEQKRLQEELDALKNAFNEHRTKILELQQRLNSLGAKEKPRSLVPVVPQWSLENFIGLRLIHFIGIIVLVIGLSIGVKYAIDKDLISAGARIVLAYAAGLALYGLSVRLKKKYLIFSAILFSGGMASLYFTTYAAQVYYNMMPFAVAFILMVMLTFYTSFEAIRYNRQEIGLLGLVGAYAIPFLISKNADHPQLFFLYITVINFGVIFLVTRKTWKTVGILAQAITWLLFLAWVSTRFQGTHQVTGTVFMLVFFFIFTGMIAFYRWKKSTLAVNDIYQLVLNNIALYISALFVAGLNNNDNNLAYITLLMACFTALQSWAVSRYWNEESYLVRMLATLALIFFVMFIAFYWSGFIVTLLWLLTAVIVFAWGFWKKSIPARMAAILLIGVTLAKLLLIDSIVFSTVEKVIAYLVLGVLLLVVSFFYQKFRQQIFGDDRK